MPIADDVASPPPCDASASRALIPLWPRREDALAIKESIAIGRDEQRRLRKAKQVAWRVFFFFEFVLLLCVLLHFSFSRFSMATALRPDTRRVAEATPAAITAAFLFEAAVSAATARTGEAGTAAAAAAGGGDSAAASVDKVDADGNVTASKKKKKRRPQLDVPSTAALSHSLALAAGKVRIEMSGNSGKQKGKSISNACFFFTRSSHSFVSTSSFSLPFFPHSSPAPLAPRCLAEPRTRSAAAAVTSSQQEETTKSR